MPWALYLTIHQPQFQEEADSVSQTLGKLSSSLDTQYSPAPGGPPGTHTELLQQLEVRWPHPAPCTPLLGTGPVPVSGPHLSQVPSPAPSPGLGGQEKAGAPAGGS